MLLLTSLTSTVSTCFDTVENRPNGKDPLKSENQTVRRTLAVGGLRGAAALVGTGGLRRHRDGALGSERPREPACRPVRGRRRGLPAQRLDGRPRREGEPDHGRGPVQHHWIGLPLRTNEPAPFRLDQPLREKRRGTRHNLESRTTGKPHNFDPTR